jgi:gliding motility-associated-like protein
MNACCNTTVSMYNDTAGHAILTAGGSTITGYSWTPSSGIDCLNPPLCDSVKVTPAVTTTYTVTGTDALGCTTERVITVTVDIPCFNPVIPNVITPNYPGPMGLNDEFYIKTENINSWSITIFDRWGKEMYKSTDQYSYWQGTTESGDKASDGVYYYIITGVCQNTTFKKDGFVQLIR